MSAPGSGTIPGLNLHLSSNLSISLNCSSTNIAPTWII